MADAGSPGEGDARRLIEAWENVEREAEEIRRRVAQEKRQASRERSDRRAQGNGRGVFTARLRDDNDTIRQNLRSAAAAAEVVRCSRGERARAASRRFLTFLSTLSRRSGAPWTRGSV